MKTALRPPALLLVVVALAGCGSSQTIRQPSAAPTVNTPAPPAAADVGDQPRPLDPEATEGRLATQTGRQTTAAPTVGTPAPPAAADVGDQPPPADPEATEGLVASGLCLTGTEAEHFLATAEVVEIETYESKGITKPRRSTLSDGTRTCRAVFKDIDVTHDREQLTTGKWLLNLKDSYKNEIAAWKLDHVLGLGLVPPCVERKIGRDTGSLCMWVEGAMTEHDRAQVKNITPPDVRSYNDQMHDIKLLMQLTWDTDYNNTANILIDRNWKLYKIDSSRAFRTDPNLRREATLTRFRRRNVDALRSLTRDSLEAAVSPWLDRKQIDGLWERRGKILQRVDNLLDSRGESAVLYD